MTKDGRPAYDLLRELLDIDYPLYHFGREVVELNRSNQSNPGNGLRDLVLDIRSSGQTVPTFPGGDTVNRAYRDLCRALSDALPTQYPTGHPAEDGAAVWTMEQMSDKEFGAVDWDKLADDVFPAVDADGNKI